MIELVLYLSLSGLILFSIHFFIFASLQVRRDEQALRQLHYQGLQAVQDLSHALRHTKHIHTPQSPASSTALSVELFNGSEMTFDSVDQALQVREGAGPWVALTHAPVQVTELNFMNLARSGAPPSLHFELTLTHPDPEGKKDYTQVFSSSISLRL